MYLILRHSTRSTSLINIDTIQLLYLGAPNHMPADIGSMTNINVLAGGTDGLLDESGLAQTGVYLGSLKALSNARMYMSNLHTNYN